MNKSGKEFLHNKYARYLLDVYWRWQCAIDDTILPLDELTLGNFLDDLRTDVSFQKEITSALKSAQALLGEFHPTQFSLAINWLREHPIMVYCHALKQLQSGKNNKEK